MLVTAEQMRAARGLLDWSQSQLAERSGVSLPTIKRMEGAKGPGRSAAENVDAVRRALEAGGIEFIPENGGGAGVRFRERGRD
jgi:transcriptional regulator with XRE-family HTH domain